jgi:hypothetical protein
MAMSPEGSPKLATFKGLAKVGHKVHFRHRTTVKNTLSDWSKSLPVRVL